MQCDAMLQTYFDMSVAIGTTSLEAHRQLSKPFVSQIHSLHLHFEPAQLLDVTTGMLDEPLVSCSQPDTHLHAVAFAVTVTVAALRCTALHADLVPPLPSQATNVQTAEQVLAHVSRSSPSLSLLFCVASAGQRGNIPLYHLVRRLLAYLPLGQY